MENEIFSGFSGHKTDAKGTAMIKAGKSPLHSLGQTEGCQGKQQST